MDDCMKKQAYIYCSLALALLFTASCDKENDPYVTPPEDEVETPSAEGVVYTSNASGSFDIWKLEGERSDQLTHFNDADAWWPRHSEANASILFYSSKNARDINDYATADLMSMDLDGSNIKTILSAGAHGWEQQGLANWSHDGTQIVIAAVDPSLSRWQIYTCDKDGTNPRRISTRDGVDYLDPIFDMDDQSILCVTVPEGEPNEEANYEVVRLRISDGFEERLTNNGRRDQHPALSPNGTHIAYESLIDTEYLSIGKWALMEVELASGNETPLLENDHINLFPRYTRNGEHLVYTRLNVESFGMTLGRLNRSTGDSKLLVAEESQCMNADPY